jgi:hypothetical protein
VVGGWAKRLSGAATVAIKTHAVALLYIRPVHCTLKHRLSDPETTDSSASRYKFFS